MLLQYKIPPLSNPKNLVVTGTMEDSRVGYEELLVARSNERCRKICGRMQLVSEDKE